MTVTRSAVPLPPLSDEPLTVFILEGPAGSGKSTFIKNWTEEAEDSVVLIPRANVPTSVEKDGARSYGPFHVDGLDKDLGTMKQLSWRLEQGAFQDIHKKVFILDRFVLSGIVYDDLRPEILNMRPPMATTMNSLWAIERFTREINMMAEYLSLRIARAFGQSLNRIRFNYLILNPSLAQLKRQREGAWPRTYTFDAEQERSMYLNLTELITSELNWHYPKSIFAPPVDQVSFHLLNETEINYFPQIVKAIRGRNPLS